MLQWFSGAKHADGAGDVNSTGYIEPPETPAPIFAVRAFKQALFGTPQTVHPKALRRNSNTETPRPRHGDMRPTRPNLTRPKSAGDVQTVMGVSVHASHEVQNSPAKGILLTPGTAATKRKNVTFGTHVLNDKNRGKSNISGDWFDETSGPASRSAECDSSGKGVELEQKGSCRLTEALENARDETKERNVKGERVIRKSNIDIESEARFSEPQSEDGKYWKYEYDIYRENSKADLQKLITKHRAAKSFAKTKDEECSQLAARLDKKQETVEKLEARVTELSGQIRDLEKLLNISQDVASRFQAEVEALKRQLDHKSLTSSESCNGPSTQREQSYRTRQSAASAEEHERNESFRFGQKERTKSIFGARARSGRGTQPLAASNIGNRRDHEPLKDLDVNMASNRSYIENGSRNNTTANATAPPILGPPGVGQWDEQSDTWKHGPLLAPSYPAPSSKDPMEVRDSNQFSLPSPGKIGPLTSTVLPPRSANVVKATVDTIAPTTTRGPRAVADSHCVSGVGRPTLPQHKVSTSTDRPLPNIASSGNTCRPQCLIGKDGKEVGQDRVEAALARIAARGRVTS